MSGKGPTKKRRPPYFSSITSESLKEDSIGKSKESEEKLKDNEEKSKENDEKSKENDEKSKENDEKSKENGGEKKGNHERKSAKLRVTYRTPSIAQKGRLEVSTGELPHPDLSRWLKVREYILIMVEASLSLSVYVIRERNLNVAELRRLKLSTRQADINMHLVEGHSSWLCLIFGLLVDSYIRCYTLALFSVTLHFAAVSIVFMEEAVAENHQRNPYAEPVRSVVNVAIVLIRSTDFTRLVYGIEGMADRRVSTIGIFIFFHFWVSTYATYGGIIVNVCTAVFHYYKLKLVIAAFVLSGVSLYLFVYFLHPDQLKEQRGVGFAVLSCFLLAVVCKIFRIRKKTKRGYLTGFFNRTEGTCSKTTIIRTREALKVYAMLTPAFAMALFIILKADLFFVTLISSVKTELFVEMTGLTQLARTTLAGFMLISYFVMWPLFLLVGFSNRFGVKFLVGHVFAVFALFYAAVATKIVEPVQYPFRSGFVRVFNTREKPVHFKPQDNYTRYSFKVLPKKAVMNAYPCSKSTLFAMGVKFEGSITNTSYTVFLNVVPYETVAYVILDPPEVIRIRGPFLPMREGPPGTNNYGHARMYIYSTTDSLDGASLKIKHVATKKTVKEVKLSAGDVTVLSLLPALYDVKINQADIRKFVQVEEGGLYGAMVFSSLSTREMAIDRVLDPDTESIWTLLGLYMIIGLSLGLSYPALRGICYTVAPEGLLALPFTYLAFLEGLSSYYLYIGFTTWHYYVTGNVLFAYAGAFAIFWVLCTFVFIRGRSKYKNVHK